MSGALGATGQGAPGIGDNEIVNHVWQMVAKIYIYIYPKRITMCPHGYHHSGSMATPALGTRDVRLHIVWIALWSHQSAQTENSERCIVQKVNVPQGGSPPNPKECSNCTGSERNIQKGLYIYIYIYIVNSVWLMVAKKYSQPCLTYGGNDKGKCAWLMVAKK